MKCNIPRQVSEMSPSDRKVITKYFTNEMYKGMDRENEKVQEVMIKLFCTWLHDHGATEEEIHAFIAWMRRTYRQLARCKTEEEQNAWLEKELARCFPGGFPQFRIDELKSNERSILDEQRNTYNAGAETEDL